MRNENKKTMTSLIEKTEVKTVASQYLQSLEEIERRRLEVVGASRDLAPASAPASLPLPTSVADQKLFLLNFCNRKQHPRHEKAGFRCLGVFPDEAALKEHLEDFYGESPDSGLHMARQGETFVICETLENQQHPDYGWQKRDAVLRWHADRRKEAKEEFDKNVAEKKTGEVGKSIKALKTKTKAEAKKTSRGSAVAAVTEARLKHQELKRVRPVSRDAELRNQNVLVIDVFIDPNPKAWTEEEAGEPLVTCWGVFGDDADAKAFIDYYGKSSHMKDRLLFGVPCYEWVFPETYDDFEIPELFHSKEIDKIINQGLKRENQEVAKFSQECHERGQPVPEQNQVFDPEHPNFKARMFNDRNEELPVVRGPVEQVPKDKFPAVPKDDPDFENIPQNSKNAGAA